MTVMNNSEIEIELNKLFDICHINLLKTKMCKEYLMDERGLSLDTISSFKIGYFPQNLSTLTKHVSVGVLQKLKIIDYSERSLFSEYFYLIFPYYSEYNLPIGLGGRTLLSEIEREVFNLPKYKNSSFIKGNYLYGLNKARSSIFHKQNAFIVEGYFDQISLNYNNIHNSVAICGTAFSKNQFLKLARYTDTLTFILDQDSSGENAMNSIYQKYSNYGLKLRFCHLPNKCKDVDEYFRLGGKNNDFVTDLKYFHPE
jgi:DNA primase